MHTEGHAPAFAHIDTQTWIYAVKGKETRDVQWGNNHDLEFEHDLLNIVSLLKDQTTPDLKVLAVHRVGKVKVRCMSS